MEDTVREDIEVTTDDSTVEIRLHCVMERENEDASFAFTPYIDEVGQLVLVPDDERCGFTSVHECDVPVEDEENGNTKIFTTTIIAHMLSDNGNFKWFPNVDEIGNAVVTPDSDGATFISVAKDADNLNLLTSGNELTEDITPEQKAKVVEDSVRQLTSILETLQKCDTAFDRLADNVKRLNLNDLDYKTIVETPLKKLVEGLQQLAERFSSNEEPAVEESLSLNEGTWSTPKTVDDVASLVSIMSEPITVDNARGVKDALYNIFGDDSIYDKIDSLEAGEDARYFIKDYLQSLVPANKDAFSEEVYNELMKLLNKPLTEGMNNTFIAVIHIDDEDGTWCKVDAPTKEMAVDFLLDEMQKKHPNAKEIEVSIDDVTRTLREGVLEGDEELESPDQEFSSAKTSINSAKLPAIFNMVKFEPDTLNLDYGGGKFDNAVEALAERGVNSVVYDPYNRTDTHNAFVIQQVRNNGGANTVTCSNVLNVIKEDTARLSVLRNMKSLVKADGVVYITVYEGSGDGNGKETSAGYQLNRKTVDYMAEVAKVFPNVSRKGKLIIARK